jgi:uncharacterized protein (TIRG00374 family)
MKKISSLILKISITAALLIFLFRKIDFKALLEAIRHADRQMMAAALGVFFLLNILGLLRWNLLLKGLGIRVRLHRLFLSYLSSLFFNLVLPSTIGGDAIRTMDISQHTQRPSSGILATVVLDRALGFFGLFIVLIISLTFGFKVFNDVSILWVTFFLLLLVLFLSGLMFWSRFFHHFFRFLPFERFKEYLYKIHEATSSYKERQDILWGALFLSVLAHVGLAVVYYLLAFSVHAPLNFLYFLILVPMITAFSTLPVSIGGLGLRDAASVVVFTKVGLTAAKAFALSLINFGFMFIVGISGGICYVFILYRRRI